MATVQDVFISYGRADSKGFAIRLHQRLSAAGLSVWFDFEDIPIGVDFQVQIRAGIESSHNFLFILSPSSVNSPYCHQELEHALACNKRIIPIVHVEEIPRQLWQRRCPNGTDADWQAYQAAGKHSFQINMHPQLRKLNWLNFREHQDDFEASLGKLIGIFQRHQDYVHQHTLWLVKGLEWQRHHRQSRYLLVAEERQQAEAWLVQKFSGEQPPCRPTDLHCEFITESKKNAHNLMSQVFLAYAEEDIEVMQKVRASLRREGFSVWTSGTDIQTGSQFQQAIAQGIETADNVVALLSPAALNSQYWQQELNYASTLNKRIIPLRVCEMNLQQAPEMVQGLQYIDLADNLSDADYRQDESQLVKILRQEASYVEDHKVLLVKAHKWQRQHRNPSLLLRGFNLKRAETWLQTASHNPQYGPTELQQEFIRASLQQPPVNSLDVFISYSRTDSAFARRLNDSLQAQGKRTWFDQESIAAGADFEREIFKGIESCDNFLFILSPSSVNSPYCAGEVAHAARFNKRFVSVLYRPIDPSNLPQELAKVQWIDFEQGHSGFSSHFNQLVRTLDTDREYVHQHTKWSQRGVAWEQAQRSSDLLLRGSELVLASTWLQESQSNNKQPPATQTQRNLIAASQQFAQEQQQAQQQQQAAMLRLEQERTREAERRLQAEKRHTRRQRVLLGAVSTALVAAVGIGVYAFQQKQKAERSVEQQIVALSRSSQALRKSEQEFEALLSAMRAAQPILSGQANVGARTQALVRDALQGAVFEINEVNRLEAHTSGVLDVGYSPNSQMVVTASGDGTARLWSASGQLLQVLTGHQDSVYSAEFSPDGRTIATASGDQSAKLWNLQGELLQTLTGHQDTVLRVAFSPDGQTLATASKDGEIKLWSRDGSLLRTFAGGTMAILDISFSPDGQTLATAGEDQTVKLWSLTGAVLNTLDGHKDWVSSVAFAPDGETLAATSKDGTVLLWGRAGQLRQTLIGHRDWVRDVAFSDDGQRLATVSDDKTIQIWSRDAISGEFLPSKTLVGHINPVYGVSFSRDGGHLVSGSQDDTAKIWRLTSLNTVQRTAHRNGVFDVAINAAGDRMATVSDDRQVKIWDLQGNLKSLVNSHRAPIYGISFSPNGDRIATASGDQTVKLWNRRGDLQQSLELGQGVYGVAFSPSGELLAAGGAGGAVKLWSQNGELLADLDGHGELVNDVAFSPMAPIIGTASWDKTAKLWDLEGNELVTLKGHTSEVVAIAFSPIGEVVATASSDKTVKLWDLQGKELETFKGHGSAITDVNFSPDGDTLVTSDQEGAVKLWGIAGEELIHLSSHDQTVYGVQFTPNGNSLVTASADGTVVIWELDTLAGLMEQACSWMRNYLAHNLKITDNDRQLCKQISPQTLAPASGM